MRVELYRYFYLPFLGACLMLPAQLHALTGQVLEEANLDPVPLAAVVLEGTEDTVYTDSLGFFSIEIPAWAGRGTMHDGVVFRIENSVLHLYLPDGALVRAFLYDVAGTKLVERDLGTLEKGRHLIPIFRDEGDAIPEGILFLRLSAGKLDLVCKIVLTENASPPFDFSIRPFGPTRSDGLRVTYTSNLAKSTAAQQNSKLYIHKEKLQDTLVDVHDSVSDLGQIILKYPPRVLDIGAPPIYGSIELFDGTQTSMEETWQHWQSKYRRDNSLPATPLTWNYVEDPVDPGMTMQTCCQEQYGNEDIITIQTFRDFQLHVEFNMVDSSWGKPANSGVFLQGRQEIQILHSMEPVLDDHDMGSVIRVAPSPVNHNRGMGKWQAYDITYRAARYDGDVRLTPPIVTVYWNGEQIHQNVEIANLGCTVDVSCIAAGESDQGIKLQSEGHDVRYRNIWIKRLDIEEAETDFGY